MHYKIKLNHLKESCEIVRLNDDAQGFVASLLCQNFVGRDIVFIAENDTQIENIEKQIRFFAPNLEENFEVLNFLAWDCLPYDRSSPKQIIACERVRTLYKLANKNKRNFLILTTANAVAQKVVAPSIIQHLGLIVKAKTKISIAQISEFLIFNGYQRQSTACDAGEFAVRGGIVDIVMNRAANLVGYRIDFFGELVESIKEFDPISQLSQGLVREVEILPASEIILNEKTCANFREKYRKISGQNFSLSDDDHLYSSISQGRHYEGMEHWMPLFYDQPLVGIFDYLKSPVLLLSREVFAATAKQHQTVLEYYKSRVESVKESRISGTIYNPIEPQLLYFSSEEIAQNIEKNLHITFNNFATAESKSNLPLGDLFGNKDGVVEPSGSGRVIDLEIEKVPDFALAGRTNLRDPMELLKEFLNANKSKKTYIACLAESSRDRLNRLLLEFNLKVEICLLPLNQGFVAPDLVMIGEQAIFGEKIARRKNNNKAASQRILEEGLSINVGDLIVHRNHGIGKFDGIHTIDLNYAAATAPLNSTPESLKKLGQSVKTDMLKILYGGSDVLFVPVEDINLLTRYGNDNPLIQLDRLGVAAWKNRKAKVRNRIKVAAEELIKIAASRHLKSAPVLLAEPHFYEEFKARFPFVETEDQLRAIDEVEEDLGKGSPMDRLICGDVGFGKTEVAMRAAFIVCSNNMEGFLQDLPSAKKAKNQIAIITPTTLLCRQHFHNFIKRFEGTGIKIKQLSRLITSAEQKKTKQELETGSVDIVIGTHALLNKNIKFKNLSLVIIDEEQHFGVAQKERMKELKNEVHLLTLSATPIPRTLQMSLTGVKDLSLIATPPIDRLAVRNFVMPYDSVIVREAVMREYQRGGKTFFVVPRVSDIREMEDKLKKSIPEVKITHAHGQMSPSELDKIMNDFYDGKIDVLLSTTIIESGIDIASANTMIIYRAEMFGLSQLYQLRGRVGRGKTRGYAYFMLSPKKLNKEAKKKLEVMQHLDDLGVGFTIASHDMDIRGSGDLLGDEQSGHIRETGAELYQQMLVEEIERMKILMAQEQKLAKTNGLGQNASENSSTSSKMLQLEQNSTNQNKNITQNQGVDVKNASQNQQNQASISNYQQNQASASNYQQNEAESDFSPQIKLGISLLIPESYMSDLSLRMSFYKKIANVKSLEDQEQLSAELCDRFGPTPEEIINLMQVGRLKHQCYILGIEKLEANKDGIMISFKNNQFKNPEKLLQMVFASGGKIKLQANQRLVFTQSQNNKIVAAFVVIDKLLAV